MFDRTSHKTRKISLTPMIDMVFLLLIFFMLTTNFQTHKAITLDFGRGTDTTQTKSPDILLITARNDNKISVEDKVLEADNFRRYLQDAITHQEKNYVIALMAGTKATVQDIIWTIDQIHLAGASNITLVNNPVKAEKTQ